VYLLTLAGGTWPQGWWWSNEIIRGKYLSSIKGVDGTRTFTTGNPFMCPSAGIDPMPVTVVLNPALSPPGSALNDPYRWHSYPDPESRVGTQYMPNCRNGGSTNKADDNLPARSSTSTPAPCATTSMRRSGRACVRRCATRARR
jgi:hypothetical protein